jgi:hypothetical protein
MDSQIKELLKNQDNAEKIRDQIAAILKQEFTNQKLLADNDSEIANKKDYDIKVYIENARPWLLLGDTAAKNPFPLVNVSLQDTKKDTGSGIAGKVKYTGTFFIDCYGCGNYQPENEKEFIPDDYLSTVRAWQTARITRNIIMSGFYSYLGMKPVVRKREIQSTVTVIPGGIQDSAISITACRITLLVDFEETSPEAQGIDFNGISFMSNDSGEVNLIDIMSDNDKENQSKE